MTIKNSEQFLKEASLSSYFTVHGSDEDFHFEYQFDSQNFELQLGKLREWFADIMVIVKSTSGIMVRKKVVEEPLNFSYCIFESSVTFFGTEFLQDTDFRNCVFYKEIDFSQCKFMQKTRFHNSEFKNRASFFNTTFNSLVDFYGAKFFDSQQFYLTDFLNVTIFSNTIFNGPVQFLYNKVSSETFVSFENAVFNESVDISRANFWCNLHVWGIKVSQIIPKPNSLYTFDRIDANEKVPSRSYETLKKIRETYRRIKQEFSSQGNAIEALRFHEYEMEVYEKELRFKSHQKNQDRIILLANKWSNDYGRSWWRGVKFTLFSTLVFYSIFLLCISSELEFSPTWEGLGEFVKNFLRFLNIAEWPYHPFGIENYIWSYFFLYLGRIVIGYGYYQTIQAFRKYGK